MKRDPSHCMEVDRILDSFAKKTLEPPKRPGINPGPTLYRDSHVGTGFMPVRAEALTRCSSVLVMDAMMHAAGRAG